MAVDHLFLGLAKNSSAPFCDCEAFDYLSLIFLNFLLRHTFKKSFFFLQHITWVL